MRLKAFLEVLYQELFQGFGADVLLEMESPFVFLYDLKAGLGAGSARIHAREDLSWKLCVSLGSRDVCSVNPQDREFIKSPTLKARRETWLMKAFLSSVTIGEPCPGDILRRRVGTKIILGVTVYP